MTLQGNSEQYKLDSIEIKKKSVSRDVRVEKGDMGEFGGDNGYDKIDFKSS